MAEIFIDKSRQIISFLTSDEVKSPYYIKDREWQRLFLYPQDIYPYLYHKIKNTSLKETPPCDFWEEIQNLYYQNLSHNILLCDELKIILGACKLRGVKLVLLKGLFLAKFIYQDLGLRGMTDIDVLIERKNFGVFKEILGESGYQPLAESKYHFFKENFYRIDIDVHFNIGYLGGKVWDRVKVISDEGREIYHLSPEDLIFHSAVHSSIEHRLKLISLLDIFKIAEFYKDEMNWQKLVGKIKEENLSVPVFDVFKKSRDLFNAPIPGWVIDCLKPRGVKKIKNRIYKFLVNFSSTPNIDGILEPLFQKNLTAAAKFLIKYLFPPKEYMEQRYGIKGIIGMATAYLVIRPLNLTTELAGNILNILCSLAARIFRKEG